MYISSGENDKVDMTSPPVGLDTDTGRDTKAVTCDTDFYLKRFVM